MTASMFALLASLALVQQTDTTFEVPPDAGLRLSNPGGTVEVRTWDRNAIRIVAEHSRRSSIRVRRRQATVIIDEQSERGDGVVEYQLTVPRTMGMHLEGSYSDFDIEAGGEVVVESLDGDIKLNGGVESITLKSVQGGIEVSGAQGKLELETVNDGIRVVGSSGTLRAETVNGSIRLENVDFTDAQATTFNGSITHTGTIHDDGNYWFSSHRGTVAMLVPEGTNATFAIATGTGRFGADFPIDAPEPGDKRFEFSLGTGSALVELESFGGSVRLVRNAERNGEG